MAPRRATTVARNPLAAIPLIAAGVHAGLDNLQLVQVRREHQPRTRVAKLATRCLGQRFSRQTRLDERGSFFWQQIDGHRSLHEIADRVADRFAISQHEGRQAVLLFSKMLMLRNLIDLKIDANASIETDHAIV